jgi:hypothetical protein
MRFLLDRVPQMFHTDGVRTAAAQKPGHPPVLPRYPQDFVVIPDFDHNIRFPSRNPDRSIEA